MTIMDFSHNSFVTWTQEGIGKEMTEMDKEYICLSCGHTYADGDTYCCSRCGAEICPDCGGDMTTIKEYEEAMKANEQRT